MTVNHRNGNGQFAAIKPRIKDKRRRQARMLKLRLGLITLGHHYIEGNLTEAEFTKQAAKQIKSIMRKR